MKKLLLTAALAFGLSLAAQQAPAPLAKGERVMFLGDSITHGGHYVSFLQLFQALRHPDRPVEIINAGISGQSAPGGIRRLDHDVFPQNPDRVFIMFGMNDVGRHNYASNTPDEKTLKNRERALAAYRKNMTELVDKLLAAGKQVVLILPSPTTSTAVPKPKIWLHATSPASPPAPQSPKSWRRRKNLPSSISTPP